MTKLEPTGGKIVTAPMPMARFQALIDTHGAAPERWPETERAAARALLDRDAEARDAVADAALLDRLLAADRAPAPSDELVDALGRRFDARHAPAWWRPAAMAALARPGLALAGVAAALVVFVVVRDPATIEPARAPTPVRAFTAIDLAAIDLAAIDLAPIDLADGAFVDDDDTLDLEIALIDRSLADPAPEDPFAEPSSPFDLARVGAPSLDEIPLD
jgi:hypothetical protein